jgi:hypothetical protein
LKVIILISERGIKIAIVLRLDVKYFVYFVWTIFKFYFKSSLILEKNHHQGIAEAGEI